MQGTLAGIISCMDFSPDDPNMTAAGSYSSVAAVYDLASGSAALILSGHKGGLTQVCSVSVKHVAVCNKHTVTFIMCLQTLLVKKGTGGSCFEQGVGHHQKCACVVFVLYVQIAVCACCLFSGQTQCHYTYMLWP